MGGSSPSISFSARNMKIEVGLGLYVCKNEACGEPLNKWCSAVVCCLLFVVVVNEHTHPHKKKKKKKKRKSQKMQKMEKNIGNVNNASSSHLFR